MNILHNKIKIRGNILMRENKYIERVLNVLPVRIRWILMKNEYTDTLYPETLDEFFSWYMNEKRIHLFMDSAIRPIKCGDYDIIDIEYELINCGSAFRYTLVYRSDPDKRISYEVRLIKGYIYIIQKTTDDNFEKKYILKMIGDVLEITQEVDSVLFTSLKDLMYTSLLAKLDAVYSKEYKRSDICEAIPCWIK